MTRFTTEGKARRFFFMPRFNSFDVILVTFCALALSDHHWIVAVLGIVIGSVISVANEQLLDDPTTQTGRG